jgi:Ca-activated chloride channel homolog
MSLRTAMPRSTAPKLICVASTLLFTWPTRVTLAAQNTQPDSLSTEQTVRVNVNLVTVGALVTDRKNRAIDGLKVSDFEIHEDGRRQQIVSFSEEEQPISLVILLDKSNSMAESAKMEQAKVAALSLLDASHPSNQIAYFAFHNEIFRLVAFTTNHEQVKSAISGTIAARGGSSPYDALIEAFEYLSKADRPRQAVVMITDGADQHSSHTLDDVIKAVQTSQAQTYLIGYFSPTEDDVFRQSGQTVTLISGREIDNPRFVFKRLAAESGAECFFPKSESELKHAIKTISKDLSQQYTLAYYSSNPARDSTYRGIEVKVNRKGVRIRARKGYRVSDDGEDLSRVSVTNSVSQGIESPGRPQISPFENQLEHREGRVIYREDFSNPASGFPDKAGFFYDQGRYHITHAGSVAANGPWLKDVRDSVLVQLSSGTPRKGRPQEILSIGPLTPGVSPIQIQESAPGAGLVFRLNERGYYAFLIGVASASQRAYFKLIRKDIRSEVLTDLIPWTPEWAPPVAGQSQRKLTVSCQGDYIQLYLSDKLVGSIHDDHLKDGITGMILFGEGQALFDDLIVEELP